MLGTAYTGVSCGNWSGLACRDPYLGLGVTSGHRARVRATRRSMVE